MGAASKDARKVDEVDYPARDLFKIGDHTESSRLSAGFGLPRVSVGVGSNDSGAPPY